MHRLTIVPRQEVTLLRQAVQGILGAAHGIGLLSDTEFEDVSNNTIERMSSQHLAHLARCARRVSEFLSRESARRRQRELLAEGRRA